MVNFQSIALAAVVAFVAAAPHATAADGPPGVASGSLVVIGGALRYAEMEVWKRIVDLAAEHAGRGAPRAADRPRLAVIAVASGRPTITGARVVEALNRAGAEAHLAPIGMSGFPLQARQAAADDAVLAKLRQCHGVFFTGGEQSRIVHALRGDDGRATPALDAVWEMYRAGGVVAGTSAGAAVTSRVMFRDAERVLPVLTKGITLGKEVDQGLGFMPAEWFIDQHFIIRGRFARAIVAMRQFDFPFGLGIDENSALVVRGGEVEVIGYKGALAIDLSQATSDPAEKRFNLRGARLSYLDRGDRMDLATRVVRPSEIKLAGEAIDPTSSAFRPYYNEPMSTGDILTNSTVLDLMCRLMDNRHAEATGLAFDALVARERATPGFEFKLSRGKETRAWSTGALGGEDLTIVNVQLDVRPIDVAAGFYK